jgi:uncharacterized membrane protein
MRILSFVLASFIILGGITHFIQPSLFLPFIPEFLPRNLINYLAGGAEILIGFSFFFRPTRLYASWAILFLMIAFLPLHIIDVFLDNPAIGSKTLAYIRLPLQFVLIFWAWKANRLAYQASND